MPKGLPGCPRCLALELRVLELQQTIDELIKRISDLEDRLAANSSNSSKAPSSDPSWAPNLKPKKPTGKKPGGQPGHKGHHRKMLPPEQVDEVVRHTPKVCAHCQKPLNEQEATLRGRH